MGDPPEVKGCADRPRGLLTAIALAAAAVHLGQMVTYALPSGQFKNLHVGLSLVVVYLGLAGRAAGRARRAALIVAPVACLLPLAWIHVQYPALVG